MKKIMVLPILVLCALTAFVSCSSPDSKGSEKEEAIEESAEAQEPAKIESYSLEIGEDEEAGTLK